MDANTFGLPVIGVAVVVAILTLWSRSKPRLRRYAWIGLAILAVMSGWAFLLLIQSFWFSSLPD